MKINLRFTLRQLRYFIAAGETGSITGASAAINISQPSISTAISHLEDELGVQLFVRHHAQGLSLTPAGKLVMRAAKDTLRSAYELYDVANTIDGSVSGPLNVGSFHTFTPLIIPEIWRGFITENPDVEMRITEGSEAALLDGLRTARLDIAFTYDVSLTEDIYFQPLAEIPSYVLLAKTHPLAGHEALHLTMLKDEPFILLDLPLSRQYFMNIFEKEGMTPHIVAETSNPSTLRSYVGMGLGYSLLTARPINTVAENGQNLSYIRLQGDHPPVAIGLATLKELHRPRIVEVFETYCRNKIRSEDIPGMRPL